jgi:DNA-binding NarL/FixJ family response regulator
MPKQAALLKPCRVLLANDHSVVLRGLETLLESQIGIEICGEASSGYEAVEFAKKTKPDLAVLDITMPELDGLEATRQIRDACPETEILILTMHFAKHIANQIMTGGHTRLYSEIRSGV